MSAVFSLLAPSPPWATIASSGLLSFGVVPDIGFTGIIRVQAIDGVNVATKDITVVIKAKYKVLLDFVEVSDFVLNPVFGGLIFETNQVEEALDFVLNPVFGGVIYLDYDNPA